MANPHRGEVAVTVDGVDYTLRLATNELCSLEDEHGKDTNELIAEFYQAVSEGKLKMRMVRSFFRAALIGGLPSVTLAEAGDIMSKIGLVEAAGLLGKAIAASLPDGQEEGDQTARPPKATKA